MGICSSCFEGSPQYGTIEPQNVSQDERRRQALEAAERRLKDNESRGIKDVDKHKMNQKRLKDLEARHAEAEKYGEGGGLKWQVG